jgi:hypothetical protein
MIKTQLMKNRFKPFAFLVLINIWSWLTNTKNDFKQLEAISKIVDHVQGQGENRFKSGAYTLVFEHFESVLCTP